MAQAQSLLGAVLTHAEPLGSNDHHHLIGSNDEVTKYIIDDQIETFRDISAKPFMIILGRRGAGKTALLTEMRVKLRYQHKHEPTRDRLLARGEPYVITVDSWESFHQLVLVVSSKYPKDIYDAELIPPEYVATLWHEALWGKIIQYFYNFASFPEAKSTLDPVKRFINADTGFQGPAKEEARRLLDAAQHAILGFLEERQTSLYFLFDNMENYPVRNAAFQKVLNGMFRALNSLDRQSARIHVTFCIPEELEEFLSLGASNMLKDFSSSYRIKWRPIDLLRIVAHRFRLSMKIHDIELYKNIERFDFASRDDIHRLFSLIMPDHVLNALGTKEDPLAYIVRHTQLNPRHILMAFNAILSRNYHHSGGFRRISQEAIRDGINHACQIIFNNITAPYEQIYPRLLLACKRNLPDLTPICQYRDLRKIETRFDRLTEDDVLSLWDTLFKIGVIGRVDKGRTYDGAERYCYGHFHFNSDRSFGLATEGEYCFHPIFSRAFGVVRSTSDPRVVYPADLDMITIS